MPRFLVSIHHPDDYDPTIEDATMTQAIDDLNDAMVAADIRRFVGGLHPARKAKSIAVGGEVSDGPYLKTFEHVGGFWVLEVGSMDEAVEWGRRAAFACRVPVEVRQIH